MPNTIVYNSPMPPHAPYPYGVLAAGQSRVTPRSPATTSRFNEQTLILTTEGAGQITSQDQMVKVGPVTLSWVDTSADYRLECASGAAAWSYLWFSFDGYAADRLYVQLTRRDQTHAAVGPDVIDVFRSVLRDISLTHPGRHIRLSGLVGQVLAQFEMSPSAQRAQDRLLHLTAMLSASLAEAWDTKTMARAAGLSVSRLHAAFRDQFGTPPATWLRAQRLSEAKRLLTETDLDIATIGGLCGYPDPPHFSREFSKSALLSPSKFRAHMRSRVARR